VISHDSPRFDQRPQRPCSPTQRRPMLVPLPYLANSAQATFPLHRSYSTLSIAVPLSPPTIPTKTATIPPHPHRNPIDMPASTAPAAHFKRLYRNCPTTATPNHTSSRGSHDRVLTFIYRLGTARQMFFPSAIIPGPPTRSLEAAASFQHDGASGEQAASLPVDVHSSHHLFFPAALNIQCRSCVIPSNWINNHPTAASSL
jgi:hypothetical protein